MFARRIMTALMLTLVSMTSSARDFENAYAVYAAGAEPCKHFTIAMKKGGATQEYFTNWIIGYLSAFNVIMPDTHNILGETEFDSAQGWLERHCGRYPNELFINATLRLTEVLYPTRHKSGLKDSAKPEQKKAMSSKPKKALKDIKIR